MHTYLSLAALSIYPASDEMRLLKKMDVAINTTQETAVWARQHLDVTTSSKPERTSEYQDVR